MVDVIPAIIAKNFSELEEKIRKVEPYVNWVQLDIMDGVFVPNVTWNNPEELNAGDFSVFLEVQLLLADPSKHIDRWISSGVKRIIIHIESVAENSHITEDLLRHRVVDMAEKAHEAGVEFGLAINPETPISAIERFIPYCDIVLVMTVSPGFSGQSFKPEVLPKISGLRERFPNLNISVDGGVNPETGKKCVEAGANILAAGSHIFCAQDI